MDTQNVNRSDIQETGAGRGPCISIYLAGRSKDGVALAVSIRLRRSIDAAVEQLEMQGCVAGELADLMTPLNSLPEQPRFPQEGSLALFRAPGFLRYHAVPFEVPDLVVVSDHFDLTPLLRVSDAGPFYLLALSHSGARLFEGVSGGIAEVRDVSFPESPHPGGAHCEKDDRAQEGPARGRSGFRARQEDSKNRKPALLGWFRKVDDVLVSRFGTTCPPVVLVGVRYLCSMFRHVSRYKGLTGDAIHGSSEALPAEELWRRGREIASQDLRAKQERIADEYLRLWHTHRASNDIRDIEIAARQGRIRALFIGVPSSPKAPASVDSSSPAEGGVGGPLERAALNTFMTGGSLYAVPPDQVPGGASAAAVFRY
jgi:hypothetical protein